MLVELISSLLAVCHAWFMTSDLVTLIQIPVCHYSSMKSSVKYVTGFMATVEHFHNFCPVMRTGQIELDNLKLSKNVVSVKLCQSLGLEGSLWVKGSLGDATINCKSHFSV